MERIDSSDANRVERMLDGIFKKFKIDVEFTKHFKERLNDSRNGTSISVTELIHFFDEASEKVGNEISDMEINIEAVLSELSTSLNIPFRLEDRDRNGIKELITKTVMRKPDFQTSNKKLEF